MVAVAARVPAAGAGVAAVLAAVMVQPVKNAVIQSTAARNSRCLTFMPVVFRQKYFRVPFCVPVPEGYTINILS